MPEDTARSLLSQGYGVDNVAARTGLSADTVARIADTIDRPDVSALVTAVHERLHDLGISQLAASKMGKLSRSTLATLGKAGKVPSDLTLAKLDELLSWEPGSARSTMFRSQPIAREAPDRSQHPPEPDLRHGDYDSLAHQIELRLRELNMSKSKFAAIGGPGRSTLATLGKRGYQPADDTLERIDRFLYWEPGSAEAVLKGGLPIRRGPTPAPHPSLVPLSAVMDRQRRLLAQLSRWEQGIAQMKVEVTEAINHVNVAITDLQDPRRLELLSGDGLAATNGADHDAADNPDAEDDRPDE